MSDLEGCRKREGREGIDLDGIVDDVMVWWLGYCHLSELAGDGQ